MFGIALGHVWREVKGDLAVLPAAHITGILGAPRGIWFRGTYKPPPGATNDSGDLLETIRASGEAFTARQA